MKTILIDGFSFTYIVERKSDIQRMNIRVKDDKVYVSANNTISIQEIEEALAKRLDSLKEKLPKDYKEKVIHVRGIGYTPTFLVSPNPYVRIKGNEIIIAAKTNETKEYKKVLYDYYEQIIRDELAVILPAARQAFREISMPTFSFKYLKTCYARYYSGWKHHIEFSTILGKCPGYYIAVTLYHELTHALVLDHSKEFYRIFESKFPNAKEIDLKTRKIYFPDCL